MRKYWFLNGLSEMLLGFAIVVFILGISSVAYGQAMMDKYLMMLGLFSILAAIVSFFLAAICEHFAKIFKPYRNTWR